MDIELLKIRGISFFWSVVSLFATALFGVMLSPEFADIVTQNFGSGAVGTIVLLLITEGVKHLRNLNELKNAGLGASSVLNKDAGPRLI